MLNLLSMLEFIGPVLNVFWISSKQTGFSIFNAAGLTLCHDGRAWLLGNMTKSKGICNAQNSLLLFSENRVNKSTTILSTSLLSGWV